MEKEKQIFSQSKQFNLTISFHIVANILCVCVCVSREGKFEKMNKWEGMLNVSRMERIETGLYNSLSALITKRIHIFQFDSGTER